MVILEMSFGPGHKIWYDIRMRNRGWIQVFRDFFAFRTTIPWACGLLLSVVLLSVGGFAEEESGRMPVVVLRGVEAPELRSLLEGLSPALWRSTRPPESEAVLRGRAQRHQERLRQALSSMGYYGATLENRIRWDALPPEVLYDVVPGPEYRLESVIVRIWEDEEARNSPEIVPPETVDVGLKPGAPARSEDILAAEEGIVRQLKAMGYPYARAFDRDAQVDHDTAVMSVVYLVVSGKRLQFGPAQIQGLQEVQAAAVQREISWFEGAWYDQDLVEQTREKLQGTGLFTLVRVEPLSPEAAVDGRIPILIELMEHKHRTISLGLQYRSDEGVGAAADWEHRNFMKLGRSLRIRSQITELEQNFSVNYDIPEFLNTRDTLTLQAKTAQIETDLYRSRRIDIGAWIEHRITPEISLGFGPALRVSRVKEDGDSDNFYLFSFPVQGDVDRRNDRMDPTRGYRLVDRMSPFIDVQDVGVWFVKNEITLTGFLPLGGASGYTLAARLHLGVVGGASLGRIPADERLYAGGGGSIRGYAYQDVGPLDCDGKPTGGRSVTDWSVELRKRINEQFGFVVFVDGGAAHETPYFDFGDSIQWGAGVGLRYFTPIGPLRFDVAVPLNRREGIDSSAQFYISIGQAF